MGSIPKIHTLVVVIILYYTFMGLVEIGSTRMFHLTRKTLLLWESF